MKLLLAQHVAKHPMDYKGFSVQCGMYFGVVKTPVGNIPVAWSGWTVEGCIALYTLIDGEWRLHWVDEDEIPLWHILVSEENWDSTPFFAE